MDPDATFCGDQAMACVRSDDPFVVHVVAAQRRQPQNSDWIRTGVTYHEFAHVLQYTNPVQTDATLPVFGGDVERMADCYALTMLDGWTLDHRTWVNAYEYWEVSVARLHLQRQRTSGDPGLERAAWVPHPGLGCSRSLTRARSAVLPRDSQRSPVKRGSTRGRCDDHHGHDTRACAVSEAAPAISALACASRAFLLCYRLSGGSTEETRQRWSALRVEAIDWKHQPAARRNLVW